MGGWRAVFITSIIPSIPLYLLLQSGFVMPSIFVMWVSQGLHLILPAEIENKL
jgi:hypothetical protein